MSTDAGEDGWQARLRLLLERHPRDSWANAASPSAAFWLEIHEHLRRDAAGLLAASDDYRRSPAQLAIVAAPRLRGLVGAMHGHHQIEDFHYFPAFRETEPRLAAGFDRLERDHSHLGSRVTAALAALDELHAAVARSAEPGALRRGRGVVVPRAHAASRRGGRPRRAVAARERQLLTSQHHAEIVCGHRDDFGDR